MYKSPIEIIYAQTQTQIEGDIFKAIQSYGIAVDKNELIQALQYDRDQYAKGYADGKADAEAALVRCKDCEWYRRDCEVDMCWCTRWTTEFLIHEENFCSYGKRRTNDGHHECFEERCRRWKKDHAFDGERENEER